MTGAPNKGVTALSGRMALLPGTTMKMVHSKATQEPDKRVTGRSDL